LEANIAEHNAAIKAEYAASGRTAKEARSDPRYYTQTNPSGGKKTYAEVRAELQQKGLEFLIPEFRQSSAL
jgi:hypothetical protein